MPSSSDRSVNSWKSLAEELGTPWEDEPASAEPAATAESQETAPSPAPRRERLVEESRPEAPAHEEPDHEEPAAVRAPLPVHEGDLFAETAGTESFEPAVEVVEERPAPAPAVAPPPEPVAPVVDKMHWQSLLGELGLELPPERESAPQAPAASEAAGRGRDRGSPQAEGAEGDIIDAELVAKPRPRREKREKAPPAVSSAPTQPFGGGLFSDDEDRRFVRSTPAAAKPEVPPISAQETEVEPAAPVPPPAEEAAPRKRGRRRTRPWTRLHSHAEEAEAEETIAPEPAANLEALELAEEVESATDLFEEVKPVEAGEDESERRRRPRRRRRRSRREERTGEERTDEERAGEEREAASGAPLEDEEEEELGEELLAEEDEDEEFVEVEERPRRERRPRREPAVRSADDVEDVAEDLAEDLAEDEADEDLDGERPAHRKIPTWEEAVGVVISINMESRAKSPGGRRRR